jgi:hypothetical protein
MTTNISKTARITSLLIFTVLITLIFSCKKKNKNPAFKAELIARADLNFVSNAQVYEFNAFNERGSRDVILENDTSLFFKFRTMKDSNGLVRGTMINIRIANKNGFSTGQVYTATDNQNEKTIWMHSQKPTGDYLHYYSGSTMLNLGGSSELKITSYDGNSIKGTFNGTLFAQNFPNTPRKLIITNGSFRSKVNR